MNSKKEIIAAVLVIFIIISGLFLIGKNGFSILSGLRAFVGGEGMWAKGQKDATFQLTQYVFSEKANRYQLFVDSNSPGYIVLAADTPKKALRLASKHTGKIHLLVTDVIMPEMNGLELSEHLQDRYPDLKRMFMSGYTANAIAHHGVLEEGVYFIQKSFSKKDLSTIIRKVLDGSNV